MALSNNSNDHQVEELLHKLADVPPRDEAAATRGKERFLAKGRDLAPTESAVSRSRDQRHIGWNINFYKRIMKIMKPRSVFSALVVFALLVVVVVYAATNVTPVSAQQILQRAASAQSANLASQGIWHLRMEIIENPNALTGDLSGLKTLVDNYDDLDTGYFRVVRQDATGKVKEVLGYDGTYSYWMTTEEGSSPSGQITRTPGQQLAIPSSQDGGKNGRSNDLSASAKAQFDAFRANPGVEVKGKVTWTDGSQAYVLTAQNYETRKLANGQEQKTLTGTTQMAFNAQNYQLLESKASIRKDGKDIVLSQITYLANEVLPAKSHVAWDMSDLKGLTMVDATAVEPSGKDQFEVLSEKELAQHTRFYVLSPIPAGFTQVIKVATDQPKDAPYDFVIKYTNPAGDEFVMQAMGATDEGFIKTNYTGGSYKTVAGFVLHFKPDEHGNNTSAMLTTPEGTSFLVNSSLSREQIQALLETLKLVQ